MKKEGKSIPILGLPIASLTQEELKKEIRQILQGSTNARILTPNPEMLWQTRSDPHLTEALQKADLLLPDGIGVLLAARLKGERLPRRLTGIDTAEWILQYAADHSLSVFLLGGREGVAAHAATRLCTRFKGLSICGTHHGYFDRSGEENQKILQEIRTASPDVLLVCLGTPAQEIWIHRNTHALPSLRLSMGIGGALDVWSENVRRAPRIMQATGTEWLYRVIQQPTRLRRLLAIPRFLYSVCTEKYSKKVGRP